MNRLINIVIIIAVISVSWAVIDYYAEVLPSQKLRQEKANEDKLLIEEDRRQKIEDRYHRCMQETENGYGDQIDFCRESCIARHLGDYNFCIGYSTKIINSPTRAILMPNPDCPPLTSTQEQKVEKDLKDYQDLCLKELQAGIEN